MTRSRRSGPSTRRARSRAIRWRWRRASRRCDPPRRRALYERLEALGRALETGVASGRGGQLDDVCINRVGSMMTVFFQRGPVVNYADAKNSNTKRFAAFFRAMRERGVLLPPSQFEANFISAAHTRADIAETVDAIAGALEETRG